MIITYYTSKNTSTNKQKSSQHRPKIDATSTQNRCKNGLRHEAGFGVRFWTDFGPNLEPSWGPISGHVGTMLAKKRFLDVQKAS